MNSIDKTDSVKALLVRLLLDPKKRCPFLSSELSEKIIYAKLSVLKKDVAVLSFEDGCP